MTCEKCGKEVSIEDAFTVLKGFTQSVRRWIGCTLCEPCADAILATEAGITEEVKSS
jgi:hypothetical protein